MHPRLLHLLELLNRKVDAWCGGLLGPVFPASLVVALVGSFTVSGTGSGEEARDGDEAVREEAQWIATE